MIEINVKDNDCGQRLDKYLFKYLKEAPSSFIYKMLRKKNIVLNGKKSDGKEVLSKGDVIKLFLSDETIEKFSGSNNSILESELGANLWKKMPPIVYEDDNIILINKPKDILSQKADNSDISVNEIALSYLIHKREINEDSLKTFTPSIVNRLDRNTSGIIIFAKNHLAAKELSTILKNRSIRKYYICICHGVLTEKILLTGKLEKDEKINKAFINQNKGGSDISTEIIPIDSNNEESLLEVHLITGKTHQIRAHLASINHPLIGDFKYGDRKINDKYKKKYGIDSQLLCSYRLIFPSLEGKLSYLSNKEFRIDLPDEFIRICKDGNMEIKRS